MFAWHSSPQTHNHEASNGSLAHLLAVPVLGLHQAVEEVVANLVRVVFARPENAHEKVAEFQMRAVTGVVCGERKPFKEEVDGSEAVVEVMVQFGD